MDVTELLSVLGVETLINGVGISATLVVLWRLMVAGFSGMSARQDQLKESQDRMLSEQGLSHQIQKQMGQDIKMVQRDVNILEKEISGLKLEGKEYATKAELNELYKKFNDTRAHITERLARLEVKNP